MPDKPPLSWPERVVGLFLERFGLAARPRPGRRLDQLPFSLHLMAATGAVELFPAGALDVLRFYQRHHVSLHHEIEYVACLPQGARGADGEGYLAYAVFRIDEDERLPFVKLATIEKKLRLSYGALVHLPRARPLLERQYGHDLEDEDPPAGPNRALAPRDEQPQAGRLSLREVLDVIRSDLSGPELVSWLEGAFRQRPGVGVVEHRYYIDAGGQLFLVRDEHGGKTLYQAETSPEALQPLRRR